MKLLLSVLLLALPSHAATYAWSPSITPEVEYVFYAHTNTLSDTNLNRSVFRINVSTNLAFTNISLSPGVWHLAVSATRDGYETLCENQLMAQVPVGPTNLLRMEVERIIDLSAVTNGRVSAALFQLKITP